MLSPIISGIWDEMARATKSVPPPGGLGTIRRIGFDGKVCAIADA